MSKKNICGNEMVARDRAVEIDTFEITKIIKTRLVD